MRYKISLIFLIMMSCMMSAFTQNRSQSFSDLFELNEIIDVRLESDFKKVMRNKDDSTNFAAFLSYTNGEGVQEHIDLEIRTRGIQRRIECTFKPIIWELKKENAKGTIFNNQSSIKLVTHCRKNKSYEQNTVLEYLIYRAFNVLTDNSFRVRPLNINYVYNGKKKDSIYKFGFMIERFKYMAERLDMSTFKQLNYHSKRIDIDHMNLVDVFQFMIGNTDYSVYKLHNVKLIMDTINRGAPLAIPYDFDWCGLISAPYAVPNSMFGTETVGDRVYRGFELDPIKLQKVFDHFNANRNQIMELFANEPLLKKSEKKRAREYLEDFYEIINEQGAVNEFIKVSRSIKF